MKRSIISIFFLLWVSLAYSQEDKRWNSNLDLDILFPSKEKTIYFMTDGGGPISEAIFGNKSEIKLKEKASFGFTYSFQYRFWGGLSIGAVTGLNHLPLPETS